MTEARRPAGAARRPGHPQRPSHTSRRQQRGEGSPADGLTSPGLGALPEQSRAAPSHPPQTSASGLRRPSSWWLGKAPILPHRLSPLFLHCGKEVSASYSRCGSSTYSPQIRSGSPEDFCRPTSLTASAAEETEQISGQHEKARG